VLARSQRQQGVATLRFVITASGLIEGGSIAKTSGHTLLDQAAQETLKKVHHFPPIPPELGKDRLYIEVPLAFRLRED
jgi:protein TonB